MNNKFFLVNLKHEVIAGNTMAETDFIIKEYFNMTQIVIDNKKYILIPEKDYSSLQKKAALKTKSEKLLSVDAARAYSKKLIRKWAAAEK